MRLMYCAALLASCVDSLKTSLPPFWQRLFENRAWSFFSYRLQFPVLLLGMVREATLAMVGHQVRPARMRADRSSVHPILYIPAPVFKM